LRICENCYRRHWRAKINKSTGLQVKHNNGNLVYVCIYCGHVQEEEHEFIPPPERVQANILYIDLETSKSLYYNYGNKVPSKYLSNDHLVKSWYMIGWAASYMGSDIVWSQFVNSGEALAWDDKAIVKRLWDLMNAAEIIAGHNVDGFDIKRANTRFKKNGLPFITGKKTIDTLKLARKAAFENNTLDYIAHELGLDGKMKVTNEDWLAAHAGNKDALSKIHTYCKRDVTEGKRVLDELIPLANKRFNFGALKKSVNDGELK
jgi:hypothetical protein